MVRMRVWGEDCCLCISILCTGTQGLLETDERKVGQALWPRIRNGHQYASLFLLLFLPCSPRLFILQLPITVKALLTHTLAMG